MELICKECGHVMYLCGIPTHVQWICERCFQLNNNYDQDLREQSIHFLQLNGKTNQYKIVEDTRL